MFEEFLSGGSLLALGLMVYAYAVMMEANRLTNDPLDMPRALRHPAAQLIFIGATPLILWPAIYVGIFDGWLAGFLAFILIQVALVIITLGTGIRSMYFGIHFIIASIAYPIGYVLSVWSLIG